MDAPPLTGDPYDFVAPGATNPGLQGVTVAWDAVRYFWGTAAQQGAADLLNITAGGGTLV